VSLILRLRILSYISLSHISVEKQFAKWYDWESIEGGNIKWDCGIS
jgi:hypothetical protein